MQPFLAFLVILSLIFSFFIPFSPITTTAYKASYTSNSSNEINVDDSAENVGNTVNNDIENEDNTDNTKKYNIENYIELDLDGYCTIDIPQSHFKESNSSTPTEKKLTYKDNKTKITMSYVTNIGSDADIPGYITREVAGVETTTNGKVEETHGNSIWMKVPAEKKIDGCNVFVWYKLSTDNNSAFWLKASVTPDSTTEEFDKVMDSMFNTLNVYYIGGTVFDTPKTGYYAEAEDEIKDDTVADTSNYKANDKANTVFKDRGGYVEGANISADWRDMEIIIDSVKFKLPCTLEDFYSAGYDINDKSFDKEKQNTYTVYKGRSLAIPLINENGTVVTVTVYNESESEDKQIDDCTVCKLAVDPSKFLSIADALKNKEILTADNEDKEEDSKKSDEEESKDNTSDKKEGEDGKQEETDEIKDDTETELPDENKSEEKEEDLEASNKEETEDSQEETEEEQKETVHEVILAGGVTWDVYTDDMISYYGPNCGKQKSSSDTYLCKWTSGNNSMTIKIGTLYKIKYIELSTVEK